MTSDRKSTIVTDERCAIMGKAIGAHLDKIPIVPSGVWMPETAQDMRITELEKHVAELEERITRLGRQVACYLEDEK